MVKSERLQKAIRLVIENLEALQMLLERCVEEGMLDPGSHYHNELYDLIEESHITKDWGELENIVSKGKTLEMDIDSWLSIRGRTSISLPWPSPKEPLDEDI